MTATHFHPKTALKTFSDNNQTNVISTVVCAHIDIVVVGIRLSCQIMESTMGLVMLCSHRWRRDWSDLSRALAWAKIYGGRALPTQHAPPPPSRPHWPDPRECRAIHLGSAWLQELPEGSHHWHPAAWGDSTPDLYSGFTSIAFSMNGYNLKAAEYRYLFNP